MYSWCYGCYKQDKDCECYITPASPYASSTSSYTYTPSKPWEGIDREKWPNTWKCLVKLYNQKDWYASTKFVYDRK